MQVLAVLMLWATASLMPATVEAAVTATCGADAYEPNDVRDRAKSTRGKPVEARVCRGDADWYYLKPEPGATLEVVVEHDPAHPVTVDLFPPRARAAAGEVKTEGNRTTLRYAVSPKAKAKAKHRLRIRSADGAAVAYTMTVKGAR